MVSGWMIRVVGGLVLVILVFAFFAGCIYKVTPILNPKCDKRADDAFNNLVETYENCIEVENNGVCKCGDFYLTELPIGYEIKITPSEEDYENKVRFSLFCNGRNAKNIYFGNLDKPEKIRVYFYNPEKFGEELLHNLEKRAGTFIGTKTDVPRILKELKEEIKPRSLYISEKILDKGFVMKGEELPFIKDVGLLFDVKNYLTLVNYKGKVAFMARTPEVVEPADCLRK